MTTEKNKRACSLLGICWHEWNIKYNFDFSIMDTWECNCGQTGPMPTGNWHCKESNPDFTTREGRIHLLEIIKGKISVTNWCTFLHHRIGKSNQKGLKIKEYIDIDYLLDLPDKPNFNDRLLTAVIEFLEVKE
jgi:hypothetical protein